MSRDGRKTHLITRRIAVLLLVDEGCVHTTHDRCEKDRPWGQHKFSGYGTRPASVGHVAARGSPRQFSA